MASPQKENGYTAIANEILEQLVKTDLLASELRVVLFVLRKTYGYQKKQDIISLSQFSRGCEISRPTIVKSIKNLVIKNILVKTALPASKMSFIFNKDYDKWLVKTAKLVKGKSFASKYGLTETSKDGLTHKRKKETITKESIVASDDFVFEEELKKLKEGKRKDYKIIALYWLKKGWKFANKQQFNAALVRELRPAKALTGYSGVEISQAIQFCQDNYPQWTMETLGKRITDLINKK